VSAVAETAPRHVERRRTCLAYSPGGHFAELERALAGIRFEDCFHVTFASDRPPDPRARRTYHVCHPRRSLVRSLVNAGQALSILLKERPHFVISTGADVAVPVFILGRLLGARTVFIETGGSLEPTLAGRLVYRFAHLFIVQWPERQAAFPKAVVAQGLLL